MLKMTRMRETPIQYFWVPMNSIEVPDLMTSKNFCYPVIDVSPRS